jgi:uncharacterized protein YydD (DUF2326 family)
VLIDLTSSRPGFKSATFEPGLNVALAIRTKTAKSKDSRNAVGKTSLVRLIDFLLGSDVRAGHVLRRPELVNDQYALRLQIGARQLRVTRSAAEAKNVFLDDEGLGSIVVTNADWKRQLGSDLFGLTGTDNEPSVRAVLAYYLRDVSTGAFGGSPTEIHRKQSALDTQPALAHLLGLDLSLVNDARDLAVAERSAKELRRAASDPVMGMTLGRGAELDAEIRTLSIQYRAFERRLSEFRVIEQYAENRRRADQLSRVIRGLNDELVMLERRLRDISEALDSEEREQPDHSYLTRVYEEAGRVLPGVVARRIAEVQEFHSSVVSNRRRYLQGERDATTRRAQEITPQLTAADTERSELMKLLTAGGALETFQQLQQEAARLSGRLSELTERRAVVERWENSTRHLQLRSAELELRLSTDLDERRQSVEEIASLYSSFAYEIYGSERPASLVIEPSKNGYIITPTIGGDLSQGVRSIVLFCFDLTVTVLAHRARRGPDFLVHDSHLYDPVEARQAGSALQLASEVCRQEGMQYIVTLNSDVLQKAQEEGPEFPFHQCLTMTDEYDTGGLFGLRFN